MLLEQAQSGADNLGFIIKTAAGNKPVDQPFKMRRYNLAHTAQKFQQFSSVVNVDSHYFRNAMGTLWGIADVPKPADSRFLRRRGRVGSLTEPHSVITVEAFG